jgi:hypothetical protein
MIDGVLRDHQLASWRRLQAFRALWQAGPAPRARARDCPRAPARSAGDAMHSVLAPLASPHCRGRTARAAGYAVHRTRPTSAAAALTFAEFAGASAVFPILASPVTSTSRPRPSTASVQEASSASRNPPRSDKPSGAGRDDQVPNDINHGHIVQWRDRPVKPFQDGYPNRPTWVIIPMRVDWSARRLWPCH